MTVVFFFNLVIFSTMETIDKRIKRKNTHEKWNSVSILFPLLKLFLSFLFLFPASLGVDLWCFPFLWTSYLFFIDMIVMKLYHVRSHLSWKCYSINLSSIFHSRPTWKIDFINCFITRGFQAHEKNLSCLNIFDCWYILEIQSFAVVKITGKIYTNRIVSLSGRWRWVGLVCPNHE